MPLLICENGAAYPDEVGPDGFVDDPRNVKTSGMWYRDFLAGSATTD